MKASEEIFSQSSLCGDEWNTVLPVEFCGVSFPCPVLFCIGFFFVLLKILMLMQTFCHVKICIKKKRAYYIVFMKLCYVIVVLSTFVRI